MHKVSRPIVLATLGMASSLAWPSAVLAAAGDLDDSFGGDGVASVQIGGATASSDGNSVAVYGGRVVVAGSAQPSGSERNVAVARFEGDGDPDPTFGGGDGFVTVGFPNDSDDTVDNGLAVLPDGKILLAGYTSNDANHYRLFLIRLRANGTLDPTFGGGDGRFVSDFGLFGAVGYELLVLPDGRFIVGGGAYRSADDGDLALWRFHSNGTLDSTFGGGDGMATLQLGPGFDEAWRLLRMPDGDILVGGWAGVDGDSGYDVMLARFRPNGALEPTFGLRGVVMYNPTSQNSEYVVGLGTSAGKIIVVSPGQGAADSDVVILRLHDDGAPDRSFGGGDGEVVRDFGASEGPNDAVIQPDGRIVVSGERDGDLFVARLTPTGAKDLSFGTAGFATAATASNGRSVTLQPNGRIVVSGSEGNDLAAARFLP